MTSKSQSRFVPAVIDNDIERDPTFGESVAIIAACPLWGLVAIGGAVKQWNDRRLAAKEQARIEQLQRAEEARLRREELRLAEELRAKQDNEIFERTNQLLTLDIGGCIATIAKQYDTYTSVWHYRCTRDNLIIRTRGSDKATVCFHDSNEMMEDLARYRWAGFDLV